MKKPICKLIFRIAFIVILWTCVCIHFIYMYKPASEEEIKHAEIEVENIVYYSSGGRRSASRLYVISDSVKYRLALAGYPNGKLHREIEIGDKLHISYVTKYNRYNLIVAASSNDKTYRTIEEYYSNIVPSGAILIMFSILQLIFITPAAINVMINWSKISKSKRKRNRVSKRNKEKKNSNRGETQDG